MNRQAYLILGFIILTVLSILAFDLYVLKYGKFWERKPVNKAFHSEEAVIIPSASTPQPTINQTLLEQAKIDSSNFWSEKLQSAFQPTSNDIVPTKNSSGAILDPWRFILNWSNSDTISGTISIGYNRNNMIADRSLILTIPALTTPLTPITVNRIIDQYLVIVQSP